MRNGVFSHKRACIKTRLVSRAVLLLILALFAAADVISAAPVAAVESLARSDKLDVSIGSDGGVADGGNIITFSPFDVWLPDDNVTLAETRYSVDWLGCYLYAECAKDVYDRRCTVRRELSSPVDLYGRAYVRAEYYVDVSYGASAIAWLTLSSGNDTLRASAVVETGRWVEVVAELDGFGGRRNVTSCEFAVSAPDSGTLIDSFRVRSVTAHGDIDNTSVEYFGSENADWNITGCTYRYDETVPSLTLVSSGGEPITVSGDYATAGQSDSVSDCMRVVIANSTPAASAALTVTSFDGATQTVTVPLDTSGAAAAYYFRYAAMPLKSYSLRIGDASSFSNAAGSSLVIKSVSALFIGDGAADYKFHGEITKAEYADGVIKVRGTLSSDEAARSIGGTLRLYALSPLDSAITSAAEPIAELPISTRFEFKASMTPASAAQSRFVVAVYTADGITPVTRAQFASPAVSAQSSQPPSASELKLGLSGTARIIESGASATVIDVPCESLVSATNRGDGMIRLYSRGGVSYYFSSAVTDKLDAAIREYSAAGVDVYLRLYVTDPMESEALTFPAVPEALSYAFNTRSDAGINQLCAVADYLSARYDGGEYGAISGFIIGNRTEALYYNETGSAVSSLADYAAVCADALRLVYNVARAHIPDIRVAVSVGDGTAGGESYDAVTGCSGAVVDPTLFLSVLAARIQATGAFDWYVVSEEDARPSRAVDAAAECRALVKAVVRDSKSGFCAPKGVVLYWRPPQSDETMLASALMRMRSDLTATGSSPSVFIIDVSQQENVDELIKVYRSLGTGTHSDGKATRVLHEDCAAAVGAGYGTAFSGSYTYWNFEGSYDSRGWFAGSGCRSVATFLSNAADMRLLRIVFDRAGSGGLCLALAPAAAVSRSGGTVDMSLTPAVVFDVTATSGDGGDVGLVFIFGSGDDRAEYSYTLASGKRTLLSVDLTGFTGAAAVEFFAVGVRGGGAYVDIASVRGYSEMMTSAELAEALAPRRTVDEPDTDGQTATAALAGAVMIVVGIIGAAALSKREE